MNGNSFIISRIRKKRNVEKFIKKNSEKQYQNFKKISE